MGIDLLILFIHLAFNVMFYTASNIHEKKRRSSHTSHQTVMKFWKVFNLDYVCVVQGPNALPTKTHTASSS